MADIELSWGTNTSEAPYFLVFTCYTYPRTSKERARLQNPIARIILPGVRMNRGTAHRYSEDAPMMENMQQALSTVSDDFSPEQLATMETSGDFYNALDRVATQMGNRFVEDAFGQVTSTLGRLDLLVTEAAFLGSSKRKYSLSWNLKSTANDANSVIASNIANTFERLSMPVVGDFASEGSLSQATRMRPPHIWTMHAVNESGDGSDNVTSMWLGSPKPCVLSTVMHGLDNQSFVNNVGGPFSYNLILNFIELENVFNYNGQITSRSEFFSDIT